MFVYYCCYLLLITTPVSFLGATETSNQPLFHPLGQKYHCRNLSQSRVCLCGCSIPPSSSVLARFGSLLVLYGCSGLPSSSARGSWLCSAQLCLSSLPWGSRSHPELPAASPPGLSFIHLPTNPDVSCTQAARTGKPGLVSSSRSELSTYH